MTDGQQPWNRNAGKFDRPSSLLPRPDQAAPQQAPDMPALTDEQERFRYRGIEPISGEEAEAELELPAEAAETLAGEDAATPGHSMLRLFVQRVERLDDEIADLQADRRDVIAEAEANGFDPKALREVIKRRKMEPHALAELDTLVTVYEEALQGTTRGQVWGGTLRPQPAIAPPKSDTRSNRAMAALAAAEAARRADLA